jgi:hypothetical protein
MFHMLMLIVHYFIGFSDLHWVWQVPGMVLDFNKREDISAFEGLSDNFNNDAQLL